MAVSGIAITSGYVLFSDGRQWQCPAVCCETAFYARMFSSREFILIDFKGLRVLFQSYFQKSGVETVLRFRTRTNAAQSPAELGWRRAASAKPKA
ncbi:hypothetical protein [Schleiferilactobacillus harbinensis]|uniref:hypothetical protein n=1 Tax=Schleiferilactobacillus harbinensis TaxID=304207 RepID=UPI0039EAE0A2